MEEMRLISALKKAEEELEEIKTRAEGRMAVEEVKFLDAHIMMLNDPFLIQQVRDRMAKDKKNVEWVFMQVMEENIEMLSKAESEYLKERTLDFHDVTKRVLSSLMYRERLSLDALDEEVILVTHNLMPSDALSMSKKQIIGLCMDAGGRTSHTSILARAFEIPAVVGLSEISRLVLTDDIVIIDGSSGLVIVNPTAETLEKYQAMVTEYRKHTEELHKYSEMKAVTLDNVEFQVNANIEVPEEVESVLRNGGAGIGLYRSEFLFLQPGYAATEEEQYRAYKKVIEMMEGRSVVIRTLDVGGEKVIPGFEGLDEENPILGWRAVRFCLSRKDIFMSQLRAILRASAHGKTKIMFPMISGADELDSVLAVLDEAKAQIKAEGISFDEDIEIGTMIEVPAAAMISDILAKKVDFFSIGTNDLIQYTIAVDRGNERIAYLYDPLHPGVLRLLHIIVKSAHDNGIKVSMCGEMAGDPHLTCLLIGFGLDELSMSSFSIPLVKKIIRSVKLEDCRALAKTVLGLSSSVEIRKTVEDWSEKHFEF
jgi:phosphotransferase system enzyme I (PtsI)